MIALLWILMGVLYLIKYAKGKSRLINLTNEVFPEYDEDHLTQIRDLLGKYIVRGRYLGLAFLISGLAGTFGGIEVWYLTVIPCCFMLFYWIAPGSKVKKLLHGEGLSWKILRARGIKV
ncbi:hypothetical protein KKA00_03190 [bacterium]|nr:hypothetical protein [bacterium]MBU1651198.1 hypothetical protein [bacterium]